MGSDPGAGFASAWGPPGPFFRVDIASDGYQALQMVEEHHYDFISTDVMHPRIDGLELVRKLRERPDTAETPILICTAKALKPDQVLSVGADDYVVKPFDPIELRACVRALLRRKNGPAATC
jgi:DNA-binding response OmpR family regulator